MRIILVSPRGFCAGVNMAIDSLNTAIRRFGTPIYVYHEIVHNTWVVQRFREQGVVFIDDLTEVPRGSHLLYSAHGVSPEVRRMAEERRLRVIDATCPLVMKVHREAIRFAREGYQILLIGHAGHDEVIGTMGEVPEAIHLIQTAADVDRLALPADTKIAYLTQTTVSCEEAAQIIERIHRRFPQVQGPPKKDICYATANRQEAVQKVAKEADLVLVVGSATSSNSRRLAELASASGVTSRLIDGPSDIELTWFTGHETVAITAGASAPESLVEECVALLEKEFSGTIESCVVRREDVRFALPVPLRAASDNR